MKKIILFAVAILLAGGTFAKDAKAGIEPSPFKDSVDAISLNARILGKQIEERLSIPLDDQMPGEVAKGVIKIHDYAGSIVMLHAFLKDIAEEFIFCPGCDVMGTEPSPFKVLRRQLGRILKTIDAYLGAPPDDNIPAGAFRVAVENLQTQTVTMFKEVHRLVNFIENAQEECTPDYSLDEFSCMERVDCEWISDDPTVAPYCCCY